MLVEEYIDKKFPEVATAYILTIKSSKNRISSSNELDSETIRCNLCWKCSDEGCSN